MADTQTSRVYLDVCCLNRPFDDQSQVRIRLEAEAVLLILAESGLGTHEWLSSDLVDIEIDRTPDPERRRRVKLLAAHADECIGIGQQELQRAKQIEALGFRPYDALHLACAESGNATVFLTTDDKLLRAASRATAQLHTDVSNPLDWSETMDT